MVCANVGNAVTAAHRNNAQNNPVYQVDKLSSTDCVQAAIIFCDMPCRYDFKKSLGLNKLL